MTGRQPVQLRGISSNERPRPLYKKQTRKHTVNGCGTHVSIHGPRESLPANYLAGAGVPEILYDDGNAMTFGQTDARSTYVIKKIATGGKH